MRGVAAGPTRGEAQRQRCSEGTDHGQPSTSLEHGSSPLLGLDARDVRLAGHPGGGGQQDHEADGEPHPVADREASEAVADVLPASADDDAADQRRDERDGPEDRPVGVDGPHQHGDDSEHTDEREQPPR